MSEPVTVADVSIPQQPLTELDQLSEYLSERFPARKAEVIELMNRAKRMSNKSDVIALGYEAMLLRAEADEWYHFATQVMDKIHGDQVGAARSEQSLENTSQGSKRPPSAEMVKLRAAQFTAPLKRAVGELKSTRDFMEKVISFCQSQQKLLASEEYGELFAANNTAPEGLFEKDSVVHPPALAGALQQMISSR